MSTTKLDLVVTKEDGLILAYADLIARRHKELAVELGMTTANFLTHHADLAGLTAAQISELGRHVQLLRVLEQETTSDNSNPYSAFCLVQRLFYLNKDCLATIDSLRTSGAAQEKITSEVNKLQANLLLNFKVIEQEIVDLKKRHLALRELQAAFEYRGLIKAIKVSTADGVAERLEFVDNSVKNLNRLTGAFLELFHAGSETTEGELSLVVGLLSFVSMLAALFSCKPMQMGAFEKASFGLSMLSRAMLITKDSLEVSTAIVPTLASSLSWVPLFGIAAGLISAGIAVGNIIKANLDYENDLKQLDQAFNNDKDWLASDIKLSENAIKLKKVLLENMSIKTACSNPLAIKSLFTKKEFDEIVKPILCVHAKQQRNRKIAKNVILASVLLAAIALSITVLCIPVFGQAIGIALAVFLLTAFIARVILNKTVLKTTDTTKIVGLASMVDGCDKIARGIAEQPPGSTKISRANYVPPTAGESKKDKDGGVVTTGASVPGFILPPH